MKRFIISILSVLVAILLFGFTQFRKSMRATECDGYFYWFKVQSGSFAECHESQYFLEYPVDWNHNGFPDFGEVVQGNNEQAEFDFGCLDGGDFCCAMGYYYWDLELTWDGRWRPKYFSMPQCVIQRSY